MSKFKSFVAQQRVTIALFAVAIVLLAVAGVGGARSALTYFSDTHVTSVELQDIGVSLVENDQLVAWRNYDHDGIWDETNTPLPETPVFINEHARERYVYRGTTGLLMQGLVPAGQKLQLNHAYPEELKVRNSGTIGQYVRVMVTKYWIDKDGNKQTGVSPSLINLNLTNLATDWLLDPSASTSERSVLYYARMLGPGQDTPLFANSISINGAVAAKVTQTVQDGVITTTYDYDGLMFVVEAAVEAVQDHNAQDATKSAWGVNLNIENGSLSLAGEGR